MDMLEIFKSVMIDGMEIVKTKELANKYKVTLKFKGSENTIELNKTCAPTYEISYCKGAVATALSSIYINLGDFENARKWLDKVNGQY
jgi:hypothetical protein